MDKNANHQKQTDKITSNLFQMIICNCNDFLKSDISSSAEDFALEK